MAVHRFSLDVEVEDDFTMTDGQQNAILAQLTNFLHVMVVPEMEGIFPKKKQEKHGTFHQHVSTPRSSCGHCYSTQADDQRH